MSFKAAVDAIRSHAGSAISGKSIFYANEANTPPDDDAWVLIEVQPVENGIHSVGSPGNRLFLHDGIIWAHVFVPSGSGDADARALADAIGDLFEQTDIAAPSAPQIVRTQAPSQGAGEAGDEKGKWFRVSVSIQFQFFYFA